MGGPRKSPASKPGTDQPAIPQELVAALQVSTLELPEKCEELDPAVLGIQLDTNLRLYHGNNCQIFQAPDLAGCAKDTVELMSRANIKGVGAVWAPTGDLHVLKGEVFAEIYRGVCNKFPKSAISLFGIEAVPVGGDEVSFSASDMSDGPAFMARLHMWRGEIEIITENEGNVMTLKKGDQIYVKDGKVAQYFHFEEKEDGSWEISEGPATQAITGEAPKSIPPIGCNFSDYTPYAHMPDALTLIIATLSAIAATRYKALMTSRVPGKRGKGRFGKTPKK